jgi:acetyl-CoA synthetase
MTDSLPGTAAFRDARDLLLRLREDYAAARREFTWPQLEEFNWALDWFDVLAGEQPDAPALRVVSEHPGTELSFAELAARSNQAANWLRELGARRGDRLLLMLGNIAPLWEVILAATKLGVVLIPASTLLGPEDVADRVRRGRVRFAVTQAAYTAKFGPAGEDQVIRVVIPDSGTVPQGWHSYETATGAPRDFTADGPTRAADPLLEYFTSGTTAAPKLVRHTHASYPAGHLSTMYWIGVRPGDVHLNVSSPGWAKHAWSNVFAPWNAGATCLILGHERFSPAALFDAVAGHRVTTLCAPPTVWRMLLQAGLAGCDTTSLRECVSAGEPLNPEVIEQVSRAWGITVRDGYGQTETTAQIGNTPGQPVRPGSMGRALPGYQVALIDPVTGEPGEEGEICLDLAQRPLGLMSGYADDLGQPAGAMRDGYYHTGDVAAVDGEGYITYVGRTDDVFKASDYRISPFELESVLIEHEAVAEAAVVPAPDPLRLAVPKAYIALAAGYQPDAATAQAILAHARRRLAPYKRVRRVEFAELPKTISGKIRRVELRAQEQQRPAGPGGGSAEFREEDFPSLRSG